MFKNIYGEDGKRLIEVDTDNWDERGSHSDSPYEKWIFCKNCEILHSAIESKAAYLLNDVKLNNLKITTHHRGEIKQYVIENIETDVMKKFWMLNLFRAHLSNRELFKFVSLGPYVERFRNILYEDLPVSRSNLNVHIFILKHLMKDLSKLSSPIFKKKVGPKYAYTLLIDGVGFLLHFGRPEVELLKRTYFDFNGSGRVNTPYRRAGKIILDIFGFKSELIDQLP